MEKNTREQGPENLPTPRWDAALGELKVGEELVRSLALQATKAIELLNLLQGEDWPFLHANPFPGTDKTSARDQLHSAICVLNDDQVHPVYEIKFKLEKKGRAFSWSVIRHNEPIQLRQSRHQEQEPPIEDDGTEWHWAV